MSDGELRTGDEEIGRPDLQPHSGAAALGRNPFDELPGPDPILSRLDALEPARVQRSPDPRALPMQRGFSPRPARGARPRVERRRRVAIPTLAEIELPEARTWTEKITGDDERRVLAALGHLVEGEALHDRFGFSPDILSRAFPIFHALYRAYFRVRSHGHEHLPSSGPAILAANHAGLLPFDAAMLIVDVMLHTDPPRLPRSLVDAWAGTLPWVNILYARLGQVVGTRENCRDLLSDGQLLLVFPEGLAGACKRVTQRYRLQPFHVGFVEQALRTGVPIIPTAVVGSDDQAPVLYDLKSLARRLHLPAIPITPTFPWLGPLGLLPYPVRYQIVYGKPLRFDARFGADAADDVRLVRYLAKQVRRDVQHLVDRNRR